MTTTAARPASDSDGIPTVPGWLSPSQARSPEDAAFLAGAALAHLHAVRDVAAVPQSLWRESLALDAAEACAGYAGRREGAGELRDAVHLCSAP